MSMDTNPHMIIPDEMRERYLERRFQDLRICDLKLKNQDWVYFERLGHQLKGNAASYGYNDLESIALQLETSALNQDLKNLEGSVHAFRRWISGHQ